VLVSARGHLAADRISAFDHKAIPDGRAHGRDRMYANAVGPGQPMSGSLMVCCHFRHLRGWDDLNCRDHGNSFLRIRTEPVSSTLHHPEITRSVAVDRRDHCSLADGLNFAWVRGESNMRKEWRCRFSP